MGAGPSDRTHRRIRTLYAAGTLAAMGDAELLRRFATGEGLDREDAFAVLARRHGPMVLSVCRRALGDDRAGADDAFQAVFLVLARKAGSLRRPDDLRPWLHGVALKAGKEARRRAARVRAREGGTLADAPAPETDADLFDLRAALDEELRRLPGRFREPILLCELEGASRREAAERLGLAEGTLSSRLARGKALLRDRLARRGLAVGALAAALAPAKAAGLDALADASARLASATTTHPRGATETASAAAAIAEGVLAMLSAAKLKALATAAVATLGLIALSAGLARGLSGTGPAPRIETRADEPQPEPPPKRGETRFRGVVVDEDGKPLAGAEVRLMPFTPAEVVATTGPDGAYSLTTRLGRAGEKVILARSVDGRLAGATSHGYHPSPAEAEAPSRIVAKPARKVLVRVADSTGAPVAGAMVEAAGEINALAGATTDASGEARLSIPADRRAYWIVARKSGVGCDYEEFGRIGPGGSHDPAAPPPVIPPFVGLTLGEPRTVRIRALDGEDGAPVAGLPISLWLIHKDGKRSEVNYWSRLTGEETGPDGVAVFDWLPADSDGSLTFWPMGEGFAYRRIEIKPGRVEVSALLTRTAMIRGRVTLPDGSPAHGVLVEALGAGEGSDQSSGAAYTADDGAYEIAVPPDVVYAARVVSDDWTAPARMGIVFPRGNQLAPIDFQLMKGTELKGRVTVGPENRPAVKGYVIVQQVVDRRPDDPKSPIEWPRSIRTDDQGRYSARVAPGTYALTLPMLAGGTTTVEVKDEPELVRDIHLPRPRGKLSGRVVDQAGEPVGSAAVEIAECTVNVRPRKLTAYADGGFVTERRLIPTFIAATSPEGDLAGLTEIGREDPEVVVTLVPVATAAGTLLDENGEPARRQAIKWGRMVPADGDDPGNGLSYPAFGGEVVTDGEGRFELPSLIVGQEYLLTAKRAVPRPPLGSVRPERPGPIDLGTLRIPVARGE